MEVTVQTGTTKSARGTSLVALSFISAKKENVCVLFQVEASPQEAKTFERECSEVIEHALLETEGDAGSRLDGTLKELNGLLKGLILSKAIDTVHAIVAIEDASGALHVSHAGAAEAYIVRAGAASQITEYTRGKPTPAFVHIATGTLDPRDTVVFSTQRLLRTVTPAQLAQMATRGDQLIESLVSDLEAEREVAALAVFSVAGSRAQMKTEERAVTLPRNLRRRDRRGGGFSLPSFGFLKDISWKMPEFSRRGSGGFAGAVAVSKGWYGAVANKVMGLIADLRHPQRKRRAHLWILAGAIVTFLLIWVVVNLATSTERGKNRAELKTLMEQIDQEVKTADNQRLTGDVDSANALLAKAEEEAQQVMNNESGLFRTEALDLLDRIRSKREDINNIVRLSPRVVVNGSSKNADVGFKGMIGISDGEFVLYDQQDLYRVVLNSIEDPHRLAEQELIVNGALFPRYQTQVYQMTDNSIVEEISGQPTFMKTEDPAGWVSGKDIKTYLRFLYVLSPENNQIYKYERLSNRYGPPAQYNINGDLKKAISFVIDSSVYVLQEGGQIVKLFRGESKPFVLRHAPENVLQNATKLYKVADGNLYVLDPKGARVVVISIDPTTGDASYVRQFVLEGDQVGVLQDLYVDQEESHLYVLDGKRLFVVDLGKK